MPDISVRAARDDELEAIGALTVAGYDADGHLVTSDGAYDHDYAGWLADTGARRDDLLVAIDHDRLVGTVTWCPPGSPHRQLATAEHQGELRTLSVAPGTRRRGVGALLVADCLRRGRDLELTEVVLASLPQMVAAHHLYATFGFTRRPELDWDPVPGVHLWAFSLPLHPTRPDPGPRR